MADDAWRTDLHERVLATFRAETIERVDAIEVLLQSLRAPSTDARADELTALFRHVHTIKGGAQAVGANDAAGLAHRLEGLLERSRASADALPVAVIGRVVGTIAKLVGSSEAAIDHEAAATAHAELDAAGAPIGTPSSTPGVFVAPSAARPQTTVAAGPARPANVRVASDRLDGLRAAVHELRTADARMDHAIDVMPDLVARAAALATGLPASDPLVQLAVDVRRLRTALLQTRRQSQRVLVDVEESARALEVVSVTTAWAGLARVARDVAAGGDHEVQLVIDGGGVEVDRAVLDSLGAAMQHLVRNAADHAIEPVDERTAIGKPPIGTIIVRASLHGGALVVEVIDDGRGIDVERVRARAIERGLLSEGASDHDVLQALFAPGFSTRDAVTDLSGRGVGLDVVRSDVEGLHGSVEIESELGHGTTFRVALPFTHGTARCLVVKLGTQSVAMPVTRIARVQRLHDGDVTLASTGHLQLHTEHGPMPAASLADVLGVPASSRPSRAMVLSAGDPVALLVDAIMGEEELVISVVPAPLRRVRYVAGVALDPQGVPVVVLGAAEVSREVRRTLPVPPPGAEGFADQLRPRRAQPVIVVADDSTTTRLLEVLILESAGYEVRAAADARDALRLLDEGDVDALVVDVQMPGFDGVRLCQELRADARFATLPIILLTALMSPADRERGLAAGADAYLVKSEFDQEQLLDVVHRLVRQ